MQIVATKLLCLMLWLDEVSNFPNVFVTVTSDSFNLSVPRLLPGGFSNFVSIVL